MNQTEWKKLAKFDRSQLDWTYYNKSKAIQKSLIYNPDPNATVKHHLRDTEEQREYNDKYYELWDHNLDGTFEYGKYMIFMTPEEHNKLHSCSDETCKKKSASLIGKPLSEEHKQSIRISNTGKKRSIESRHKQSVSISGQNNHNYGKSKSEETKRKISESVRKYYTTDEHRAFISQRTRESMTDEKRLANSIAQKERFANMSEEERLAFRAKCKETANRDDVRLKDSESHKRLFQNTDYREKVSEGIKRLWQNEDYRNRQREASKNRSPASDETKEKCRQNSLLLWQDEAYRRKVSDALKAKGHTKEHDGKVRESRKQMSEDYKQYKATGGELKWNDYQKWYKENNT